MTLKQLHQKIVGSCTTCKGTGLQINQGEFVDCDCLDTFKKQALLLQSGIPVKFQRFDLRNLTAEFKSQNSEALRIVYKYIEHLEENINDGYGLFFQSDPHLAKSALSSYILMRAMKSGFRAMFIKYSELITLLFDSLDFNNEEAKDKLEYFKNCDIVCLDRIDQGYVKNFDGNNYVLKRIDELITNFTDNRKTLLVTSNASRDQLDTTPFLPLLDSLVDIVFVGSPFKGDVTVLKEIMSR